MNNGKTFCKRIFEKCLAWLLAFVIPRASFLPTCFLQNYVFQSAFVSTILWMLSNLVKEARTDASA